MSKEGFQEEWRFEVRVTAAKGPCRAGHKVGDRWAFEYGTPEGLCGEAFYTIYPVVHAMRLGGDVRNREDADPDVTTCCCPDNAWLTFEVRRIWQGLSRRPEPQPGQERRPQDQQSDDYGGQGRHQHGAG